MTDSAKRGLPKLGGNSMPENPAAFFAQWDGAKGQLYYNFKDASGNWKNAQGVRNRFTFAMPTTFIVLDQLNSVKGFSDKFQEGFYSNEVRDVRTDVLAVRRGSATVAKGLWSQIKDELKTDGAKFCKVLYVAMKAADGQLQLAAINATGAFMAAWFEFTRANADKAGAVQIVGTETAQKGAVTYHVPLFKFVPVSDETADDCFPLIDALAEYHKEYFRLGSPLLQDVETETTDEAVDEGLEYQKARNAAIMEANAPAPAAAQPDDVYDDDIPF